MSAIAMPASEPSRTAAKSSAKMTKRPNAPKSGAAASHQIPVPYCVQTPDPRNGTAAPMTEAA